MMPSPMQWREDLGPARAGDADARERLREYLTPFAHGVALAHAPHHLIDGLVPRILDSALATMSSVPDAQVGAHVMSVARKQARDVAGPRIEEQGAQDATLLEARQTLSRLRVLPDTARERFFLRVVDGIPGPELTEVSGATLGEVRGDLERSAEAASRALGQPATFSGDDYLWELSGAPPPLLAQLEMQLPVLRFDPTAAPQAAVAASTAGTFQELPAVGAPIKPLLPFSLDDETSVGTEVSTEPGVAATKPPPPIAPNPFEPQVRTIAATDLPVEARGQVPTVPWSEGSSSKSGRQQPLPPRPVPQPGEGAERSGKSGSGKRPGETSRSGRQSQVPGESSKNLKQPPMPGKLEVTKDAPALAEDDPLPTMAKVPPLALQHQAEQSMLGRPTISLPISAAIGETRVQPIPAPVHSTVSHEETRLGVAAQPPPPERGWLDGINLKGAQPLFFATGLLIIGVLIGGLSMYSADRQQRASWPLTQVVVAAEDLAVGDAITVDNTAIRSVPETFSGRSVVKADAMNMVLDQRLATALQMGDPIFYSQLVSMRVLNDRISPRIAKRLRAYTIDTPADVAVGRFVRPSDLVDVVVSFPIDDKGKPEVQRRAVTLLQKVPVLATGQLSGTIPEETVDATVREYAHVTLLLAPEEAEALTLARQLGRVKLTLRNEDDLDEDRELRSAYTDSNTLLQGDRQALKKKRDAIIRVIRGPVNESQQLPKKR
ncbi:MAG: Flp pilus assembly protein CpaB [Archangium sp.]